MTTRRQFIGGAIGAAAALAISTNTGARGRPSPTGRASRPGRRGPTVRVTPVPPPPQNWRAGTFINRVDAPSPMVAMTFDDGPSPYNTDRTLIALDRARAKATFFMIGVNVRAWPEIARRVRDAGHEIGNHSVYHTPYRASSLAAQIGPNQVIIRDAVGSFPVANRTPGLTRGDVILSTCRVHNMYECHTDRDTSDWRSPRWSASRLFSQFAGQLHPGYIALYHDGGERRPTPDAVPSMLALAQSRGYRVTSATEMVNTGTPRPGGGGYRVQAADAAVDELVAGELVEDELGPGASDPGAGVFDPADDAVDITCNYDPVAEMLIRLDDPTIKRAERSRIVEVLADIETHNAESLDADAAFEELGG